MTFGEKLRKARKAKNLTQKMLATQIDAAHNSISNWENDQNMPDPDTIQYLCWALDVQPNYFFDVNVCDENNTAPVSSESKTDAVKDKQIEIIRSILSGFGIEGDITDNDLVFLQGIVTAIQAHFQK